MDSEGREDANVYDLVTQLVKHILQKNRFENDNFYMPPKNDVKTVKNLRSKAFEILLNKSNKIYDHENAVNPKNDPLVEILKYAFVLKLSLRRLSEAEELENLINGLIAQETTVETMFDPILRLLIELRSFQTDAKSTLDVFHYGKTNPLLPKDIIPTHSVPMFQTYPMESFIAPEKFETMLGIRRIYTKQDASSNLVNKMSFEDQHISKTIIGIETIRYNNAIEMAPNISRSTETMLRQYNMITPFLTHVMQFDIDQNSELYLSTQREKLISNTTLPYEWVESIKNQNEDDSCGPIMDNRNHNFANHDLAYVKYNINLMWKEMQSLNNYISRLRTWESFGIPESPRQALFITDLPESTLHLARIRQTSILSLLPRKVIDFMPLMREVSLKKFLSDIKLLLFGIDSDSFKYDTVMGFKLDEDITVHGISSQTLKITCQEAICWGDSFKSLSELVTPNPQTGKLQQDGLIFKAMCTNVKELLLYYRAALQRILNQHEFHGPLSLFKRVRPLAQLIVEVARLCGCNKYNQTILGGGSRILTHIYKQVTKVTNPKVALVFYSILKACCEVYFRLLQNWLFEGSCDDVYGEFMIQARSQYLRKKGRKFWTESFAIDVDSVPGFLSDLSESILQCGKTLRLLRICSPKNPVCNVSTISQPEVRVCLSVSMLREQLLRCQEYENSGKAALGPVISILSAIQNQKKTEKERAVLVIRAQQETLSRINKQREELFIKAVQSKRALLQTLKTQAEESALFKEKEKELEILADKLLLEKINREQEELQEQEKAERERLINYYNKLTADVEKSRIRSNWRKTRMDHFKKRMEFLESTEKLDKMMSESIATSNSDENTIDNDEQNTDNPVVSSLDVSIIEAEPISNEDENRNFAQNNVLDVTTATIPNYINSTENLSSTKIIPVDIDISSNENHNSDKNIGKQIVTNKDSVTKVDTQNVRSPQDSLPLNYVFKKNNERSNLQDFLRDEAMKDIRTIMNVGGKQTSNSIALDACLNNISENDQMTDKIINRPKSLAIGRIDNMAMAQANKLKVLMQEYGMTPNNNEFNTVFSDKHSLVNRTNINDNSQTTLNVNKQRTENINNNVLSVLDVKLPEQTIVVGGSMNNEECLDSTVSDKSQEPILNNVQQQNIVETPMSCTTDNFTTLSAHTPLSQIQNSDDIFALNTGQDTSSLYGTMKSITEETCFGSPASNFKLPDLFSFSPDVKSIAAPTSLTIADVEMIDHTSLQVYLEKSVIIPLQIQSRLVNNAIIKYLVNEHNMLLHLHSLRSYFFLLNGEFAKSLTDSLYSRLYAISAPIELFNSATLTNLLEKALMNSFSNNYVNSELLSLSAVDKPSQLYISDPNVLECLCLHYKISWPLNIILDDTMMLQYNKVFKFLIMTGRMSWVLQEDFNIMKTERNAVISEQYHKLQLYRHSMTQFMNALHNYLTCSVLHASWSEFEKDLQNSRTIDQIYISHVNYIKKILSRCMLNTRGEKMRLCLINIFKIILKFHNRLRSQTWNIGSTGRYVHPNFKCLEQMYQSFCEWRTYMAHVAHKLATSGYQPHLTHFLNTLNLNHMYDLTMKQ